MARNNIRLISEEEKSSLLKSLTKGVYKNQLKRVVDNLHIIPQDMVISKVENYTKDFVKNPTTLRNKNLMFFRDGKITLFQEFKGGKFPMSSIENICYGSTCGSFDAFIGMKYDLYIIDGIERVKPENAPSMWDRIKLSVKTLERKNPRFHDKSGYSIQHSNLKRRLEQYKDDKRKKELEEFKKQNFERITLSIRNFQERVKNYFEKLNPLDFNEVNSFYQRSQNELTLSTLLEEITYIENGSKGMDVEWCESILSDLNEFNFAKHYLFVKNIKTIDCVILNKFLRRELNLYDYENLNFRDLGNSLIIYGFGHRESRFIIIDKNTNEIYQKNYDEDEE